MPQKLAVTISGHKSRVNGSKLPAICRHTLQNHRGKQKNKHNKLILNNKKIWREVCFIWITEANPLNQGNPLYA